MLPTQTSFHSRICVGEPKLSIQDQRSMGGGDVGMAFDAALARTGTSLTSTDLVEKYLALPTKANKPVELEKCKFFDLFDADPVEARKEMEERRQEAQKLHGSDYMQKIMMSGRHHPLKKTRQFDFRLTSEEKKKLKANGFVAVERMKAQSFAEVYYRLYTDDLPVYVTTDSILHAWHRSFDAFLIKLETMQLAPMLDKVLSLTLAKCQEMLAAASELSVSKAVKDVEDYLVVGLSLLRGELQQTSQQLESLWSAIHKEQTVNVEVLSAPRTVDFSLFKPRGHYTKTDELKRYFRAMLWLGATDFRIAGSRNQQNDLHQLLCAVVLVQCLQTSNSLSDIESADSLISCLVADGDIEADSLSATELTKLVAPNVASSILGKLDTTAPERMKLLLDLQQQIVQKGLGTQLITGHPLVEDGTSGPTTPTARPTSFALLGQRFVWSAFIFTRLVYDQVVQNETKLARRIPSALDVAFTLFGNNEAATEIARRMQAHVRGPDDANGGGDMDFVPHRDGIPFASNLIALRQVIDEEFNDNDDSKPSSMASQEASISTMWLRALRVLSKPPLNTASVFHSSTWQHRQMNTQIASFTQLRHDTVLYAKQSYTCGTRCEYPDGMVDPYPVFWQRMGEMAQRMKEIAVQARHTLADSSGGRYKIEKGCQGFENFASTMKVLEEISLLQTKYEGLNAEQVRFMKSVMEQTHGSGATKYNGWYPQLFYESPQDSGKRDVLVVDIHTDIPSVEHGDLGSILHLGVGDPVVAFFVVNEVMYAGPVFSSYEVLTPIDKRLSDEEFQAELPAMRASQWAQQSYLCSSTRNDDDAAQTKESSQELPHWECKSYLC